MQIFGLYETSMRRGFEGPSPAGEGVGGEALNSELVVHLFIEN